MPSRRYQELVDQIDTLRKHLLPAEFDPTGLYDDMGAISTKALAFRVLAHAEIEAFFEDRALEAVREARTAWLRQGHVSKIVLCLLSFSGRAMTAPPETLTAPTENKKRAWPELVDIGEKVKPVLAAFYNFVRNENHGIKEKNLLSLLLPIGVSPDSIDQGFLADMDSFGSLRGAAAHSSTLTSVRQGIDPADEFRRVASLMTGILALDNQVDELLRSLPAESVSAVDLATKERDILA